MGNTYNAIYSVKGGCGKTAFSILLSYYLSQKTGKEGEVCLVDTDIMGSSMLNAFLPFLSVQKLPDCISKYRFINEIVDIGRLDDTSKFFISTNYMEDFQSSKKSTYENKAKIKSIGFDIIFCSPKSGDINKFRIGEDGGFDTDIFHQMFKSAFCGFMNEKNNLGSRKNIVFDMPPGSDGFSNVVFNSIFRKDNTKEELKYIGNEDDIRNLFFIINLDYGHIATVLRELETLVQKSKIKFPDNIFIVINSTTSMSEKLFRYYVEERVSLLIKSITQKPQDLPSGIVEKPLKLEEGEYDSIHFIFTKFNEQYSEALCDGSGLAQTQLSKIFESEISIKTFDMSGVTEGGGVELFDVMMAER